MSSKTKIVVFKMKELIYTGIFAVLLLVFLLLFLFMFRESRKSEYPVPDETSPVCSEEIDARRIQEKKVLD